MDVIIVLTVLLIVVGIIDARYHRIPNVLCLAVAMIGIPLFRGWDSILGAALAAGLLSLISLRSITSGLGGGDIKLVAALGLSLGVWGTLLAVLIGFSLCLLCYFIFWRRPERAYPLGPFLAVGAAAVLWQPLL